MSGIMDKQLAPSGTGAFPRRANTVLINRDQILARVANGDRLKDIAHDLGITKQTIANALSDDIEYQKAKAAYHDSRLDQAEQMILDADDNTSQARARSYWQAVSWRASKEQRDIYGDRPDQGSAGVTIVINTQDSRGVLIQGDGGGVRAGGGELGGASRGTPSSTDLKVLTSSTDEDDPK